MSFQRFYKKKNILNLAVSHIACFQWSSDDIRFFPIGLKSSQKSLCSFYKTSVSNLLNQKDIQRQHLSSFYLGILCVSSQYSMGFQSSLCRCYKNSLYILLNQKKYSFFQMNPHITKQFHSQLLSSLYLQILGFPYRVNGFLNVPLQILQRIFNLLNQKYGLSL